MVLVPYEFIFEFIYVFVFVFDSCKVKCFYDFLYLSLSVLQVFYVFYVSWFLVSWLLLAIHLSFICFV